MSEGVFSAEAVRDLARRLAVEMPICFAVDAIVNRGVDIDTEIAELLDRPIKEEMADLPVGLDRSSRVG